MPNAIDDQAFRRLPNLQLPPTLSRATYGVTDKDDMRGICYRTKR